MFPKNVRFQRSFECKKKKKKEGTTRNVNIKMDFKHRVPFREGEKTGSRKDRGQKRIYSIHFKRARREREGKFRNSSSTIHV